MSHMHTARSNLEFAPGPVFPNPFLVKDGLLFASQHTGYLLQDLS